MNTTLDAALGFGAKLNGWLKVLTVIAGLVVAFVTLRSDVGYTQAEVRRVEQRHVDEMNASERRVEKRLDAIDAQLNKIEDLLREQRR